MIAKNELAMLSLYVYNVKEKLNTPNLPTGWTALEVSNDEGDGFSYGIFKSAANEIVVSYTGTNEGVDWASNVPAGIGLGASQITKAALTFIRARDNHGSNITLTGHSLGGGLASVMAVWFDRPAVVFDHASFELSARNPLVVLATKAALAASGYSLGSFAGYNGILDFSTREANVVGHHIAGEALELLRAGTPTIGNSTPLAIGPGLGKVDLHSMKLFNTMLMSPAFLQASFTSESVLARVMDGNLYQFNTGTSEERDFLIDLIRSEQTPTNAASSKLDNFALDLQKLGTNLQGLNKAAQDAIIAQGIEWYYWFTQNYSGQRFFNASGDALQYTTAKGMGAVDGFGSAKDKAEQYTTPWMAEIAKAYGVDASRLPGANKAFGQWSIALNATASATAVSADKTQFMLGGEGSNNLTGGDKDDVILAGGGADLVRAGGGKDEVYGGDGFDQIHGDAGDDEIVGGADADRIDGGADDDKIWGDDQDPESTSVVSDDTLIGSGGKDRIYGGGGNDVIYGDAETTAEAGGPKADADMLYGGKGKDTLYGGGGEDELYGGDGADELRGGAGNDKLDGGKDDAIDKLWGEAGNDQLNGGAGFDSYRRFGWSVERKQDSQGLMKPRGRSKHFRKHRFEAKHAICHCVYSLCCYKNRSSSATPHDVRTKHRECKTEGAVSCQA